MATRISIRRAALAFLLAAACNEKTQYLPPPLDRFFFPTGMALRHVDQPPGTSCEASGGLYGLEGCQTQLFVASSDADLTYDPVTGGTVLGVDVNATLARDPLSYNDASPIWLGGNNPSLQGVRIGSYAGQLAILDGTTCPGIQFPSGVSGQVLVTSRSQNELYRIDIRGDGGLSCSNNGKGAGSTCDASHTVDLLNFSNPAPAADDTYGVTVVCGNFPRQASGDTTSVYQQLAFLTYVQVANSEGGVGELNLVAGGLPYWQDLAVSIAESTVYDPVTTRLFATEMFAAVGVDPLRWLTLASPGLGYQSLNMEQFVRGGEVRGIALSTDRTRLYLAMRLYDTVAAGQTGTRPLGDIGGALVVLNVSAPALDPSNITVENVVPIERGASQIAVVPRPASAGLRDLVAVVSETDESLELYDDETGAIANVYGFCVNPPDPVTGAPGPGDENAPPPCDPGKPLLGQQPSTLLVEPIAPGAPPANVNSQLARLYVASYDRSWVNVITIDPLNPSNDPIGWVRIGQERPNIEISNVPDPL